jgi:hypothetical protein
MRSDFPFPVIPPPFLSIFPSFAVAARTTLQYENG